MTRIKRLITFIRRDTLDEETSTYFLVGLRLLFGLMTIYYVIYMLICAVFAAPTNVLLVVPWSIMMTVGFGLTYYYSDKSMFLIYQILIVGWTLCSIYSYGWNIGGQQFLLPLLVMVFFCVYYSVQKKILIMFLLLCLRLGLFLYCQENEPKNSIGDGPSIALQVLNSVFLFLSITFASLNFSSNIQKAEKKLMRANENLKMQAGTDVLTGLPNRREMSEIVQKWRTENPMSNFAFAMADIDFFKTVNDTWGHECGDEVLKRLSALFKEKMQNKGYACRWGGEEFFFFFPEMNLDEAGFEMEGFLSEVRRMEIPYGEEMIRVTMTFGVEENDYQSDLMALIRQADEKLYYGKEHGRNCVIS